MKIQREHSMWSPEHLTHLNRELQPETFCVQGLCAWETVLGKYNAFKD